MSTAAKRRFEFWLQIIGGVISLGAVVYFVADVNATVAQRLIEHERRIEGAEAQGETLNAINRSLGRIEERLGIKEKNQ